MSSVNVNQRKAIPLNTDMKPDKGAATGSSACLGSDLGMLQLTKFPRRPLLANQLLSTTIMLSPCPVYKESESQSQGNASTLVMFIFCLCALVWSYCHQHVAQKGHAGRCDASGSSAQECDKVKTSGAKTRRASNKKGKGKATDDDPNDQPPDDNASRLLAIDIARLESSGPLQFVCPFLIFNPIKYAKCIAYRAWNYDRLKKHLSDNHAVKDEHYCPKCFSIFKDPEGKAAHVERAHSNSDHCLAVAGHDQITPQEWYDVFNKSDSTRPRGDDEKKYFWMWDRLFEGQQRPETIRTRGGCIDFLQAFTRQGHLHLAILQGLQRLGPHDLQTVSQEIINNLMNNVQRAPRYYRRLLQQRVNHENQTVSLEAHMTATHSTWDYRHQDSGPAWSQLPESWPVQDNTRISSGIDDSTSLDHDMFFPTLTDMPLGMPLGMHATEAAGHFIDPGPGFIQLPMLGMPGIDRGENARSIPYPIPNPELVWNMIKHLPMLWENPDGPKWEVAEDCIDVSQLSLVIRIREDRYHRYLALERGG